MADAISAEELKALMSRDENPAVFDVRRKADFEAAPGRISNAPWRDPEKVDEWIGEIPQGRPVVVYCVKGGSVSQSVADRIRQTCPDAKFLQGGIKGWAELGELVED